MVTMEKMKNNPEGEARLVWIVVERAILSSSLYSWFEWIETGVNKNETETLGAAKLGSRRYRDKKYHV